MVARLPCVTGKISTENNVALTGLLEWFRIFNVHVIGRCRVMHWRNASAREAQHGCAGEGTYTVM